MCLCMLCNRRIERLAAPFVCGLMLLEYALAAWGRLEWLTWIAPACALCALAVLLVRLVKGRGKMLKAGVGCVLTPGLLCLAALAVLFHAGSQGLFVNAADDIHYWAIEVRSLYAHGGLVDARHHLSPNFMNYTPGMALYQWTAMAVLGEWNEPALFAMLWLFYAVMLLPHFEWVTVEKGRMGRAGRASCHRRTGGAGLGRFYHASRGQRIGPVPGLCPDAGLVCLPGAGGPRREAMLLCAGSLRAGADQAVRRGLGAGSAGLDAGGPLAFATPASAAGGVVCRCGSGGGFGQLAGVLRRQWADGHACRIAGGAAGSPARRTERGGRDSDPDAASHRTGAGLCATGGGLQTARRAGEHRADADGSAGAGRKKNGLRLFLWALACHALFLAGYALSVVSLLYGESGGAFGECRFRIFRAHALSLPAGDRAGCALAGCAVGEPKAGRMVRASLPACCGGDGADGGGFAGGSLARGGADLFRSQQ